MSRKTRPLSQRSPCRGIGCPGERVAVAGRSRNPCGRLRIGFAGLRSNLVRGLQIAAKEASSTKSRCFFGGTEQIRFALVDRPVQLVELFDVRHAPKRRAGLRDQTGGRNGIHDDAGDVAVRQILHTLDIGMEHGNSPPGPTIRSAAGMKIEATIAPTHFFFRSDERP